MSKRLTKVAIEAVHEAETEELSLMTPYAFYGFAKDPFYPILPLDVEEEEQETFENHFGLDFFRGFIKKVGQAYNAKLIKYESFYRMNKTYGSDLIPNLILCGPPNSGRTTICRILVSVLNKPEIHGQGAAVLTSTNEWATIGSNIAEGMQRWLDPAYRKEDGRPSLVGLKVLFIDHADTLFDFLAMIHAQIQDLARGPVILIPVLTPIGYDYLAEYCEQDPEIGRLFGLGPKVESRARLTVWVKPWSVKELHAMLRNRLYIAGGKLSPFSEELLEQISRHSLGLPGVAIELAENIMRRSADFGLEEEIDESHLDYFVDRLGIMTAEQILRGALEERQVVLTSGFEVPSSEDSTTIPITGSRKDILEVILRQLILFGDREVQGERLADPKEHEATQRTIDVKRSTLSYHLTNLVKDGVLSENRHGRSVGYLIRNPIGTSLQMILSSSMRRVVM